MAHITTLTRAHTDIYNSNANTYSYSGSFETFKETEVIVKLDGVALTYQSGTINESASPRQYTVNLTDKTVHIGGADLSSGTISIYPVTDLGAPTLKAPYTAGSAITASDLTNNQLQVMRKAMEFDENKFSSTGGTLTGDLTLGVGTKIILEGATDDAYETTLTVTDPTADRTITLPNVTGTVVTTGDSGTVATGMIAADAITGAKIADDALDSEHYTDGSIDAAHLASSSVTTAKINSDAVTGAKIADDAIDSEHYTDGSIDTAHYAAGSVDATALGSNAVTTAKINADAVTGAKIADDAINSEHYTDGSIDTAHIADSQITTAKIADDAVTIAKVGCEQTTISDSDSHLPTSGAVVDYVSAAITPLGGFEAIATEDVFPTTVPAAGVIVSIADATEISVNSSGVATNCRTDGNGSDNVTINGFPSILRGGVGSNADPYVLPASSGLLVVSTGSSHTYNYHRLIATTEDIKLLSDTVESFKARYRVASSAPGSDNNDGDIYYNTTNDTLYVYDGSQWEESVTTTPGDDTVTGAKIVDNAIDSEHYTDGSIDHVHLAADAVDGDNIADDSINSEHYVDGSIDTAHIADNQVTLAKMAGIARGKIIYGDSSGDPAVLAVGSNGQVLTSDGTDISWGNASAGATGGNSNANKIFWENEQTVTHDYTIQNNYNAGSFGPITINNGVTVTVGSGETWTIV